MSKKLVIRTGVAAAAITAMGLVAASPAAAHTNNMYTYVDYSEAALFNGFATYGKADGVVAPLPNEVEYLMDVVGIEIHAEKGTAIGYAEDAYVTTWDHTTGANTVPVVVYVTAESIPVQNLYFDDFSGLDTLNDGRTVTLVEYEHNITGDLYVDQYAIALVDAGTGALTPIVDLTDVLTGEQGEQLYEFTELATHPVSGLTYVFLANESEEPFYLVVDVAAGTVGEPTLFQGADFEDGVILGADFDPADGTLYFNYANDAEEQFELSKLGSPTANDWVTTARTYISTAPAQYDDYDLAQLALTIEHTALAATGAELPVLWLVAGTLAVLAGGTVVMVARRKADAGTV